ncbi:hypothetical protein L6164_031302 [Bauhinia variegata]|uniref:Uncharacterized protein n=1 Tax=Bauhinia variegata TaxID=167791 RepID=A0ACB9LGB7_BAUVA|nr:hypothetical protein L6164_031302 [Bauhinia variegata]
MDPRERNAPSPRMTVPQFGGWENNALGATNYSVVFTQARQNKKHQKADLSEVRRRGIGKEEELAKETHQNNPHHHHHDHHHHGQHHHGLVPAQVHPQEDTVVVKRRMLTYINCCIRP